MNFSLRFSNQVFETLKQLHASTGLTPNILARIAISLSLNDRTELSEDYFKQKKGSVDINRNTLTGEYDYVFKALIAQHCKREISDEEYFPELINAHIERGVKMLENSFKFSGNFDKFMRALLS